MLLFLSLDLTVLLLCNSFSYCQYHYGNYYVDNINDVYIVTVATSPTINMAQTQDILNVILMWKVKKCSMGCVLAAGYLCKGILL